MHSLFITARKALTLVCFTFGVLLLSCEKEVKVDFNTGPPKLVVEGAIETDVPPYVILTKSLGYLDKIDLNTLQNSFVHDALVKVSDGTTTITLREYAIDTGINGNKFSFYSIDTADAASLAFVGKINHSYHLTIEAEGKSYEATTVIPNPKPLDTLWVQKPDQAALDKVPLGRLIYFRYFDPDTLGNSVRIFTKRNSEPFYPALGSVANDEIVNGGSISTNISLGYDKSKTTTLDSLGLAFIGDTVTVKWCAIDRDVYNFYNTLEYSVGTVGSPFASPINVRTNIKGGGLGVWAGYGATFKTIIVKD